VAPAETTPAPLLSVIVPTHDTRELTLRCLAALEADPGGEPGAERETVLVDDGSSDGTAEAVAARFPAVRVLRRPRAGGFSVAANAGLDAARGGLLLLLNSDTEVVPGALAALRAAFDARLRLGIAGAALSSPDGRPQWSGGGEPTRAWLFLMASGVAAFLGRVPGYRRLRPLGAERRGPVDWVSGAALALRREAWEALRPLDESFGFYCQDLDLCLRARDRGWQVALLPEVKVRHHGGATIGRREGSLGAESASGGRAHPGLLWTDLLRVVRKRHGDAAATRAADALEAGARLRLMARALAGLGLPGTARRRWQLDTGALRQALDAVASWRREAAR
jgi:GT2 family glycosyltransferase